MTADNVPTRVGTWVDLDGQMVTVTVADGGAHVRVTGSIGAYGLTILGPAADMRRLAAALTEAADRVDAFEREQSQRSDARADAMPAGAS